MTEQISPQEIMDAMMTDPNPPAAPPAPAVPLIEVTDRAELDPYLQVDPFYVGNKDPNFYYCWLRDKPNDIERNRKIVGYELVTLSNRGKATPIIAENAVGEYRVGDTVLARMPIERYNRLESNRIKRVREQIESANEEFVSGNVKVQPFDTTRVETREGRLE